MFEEMEKMETDSMQAICELQSHCSNATQFFAALYFDSVSVWGKKKIKRTRVVVLTLYLEKRNLTLIMMTAGVTPH